ncbi:CinA family nicotinamide mononucleotide deamidase-related protein [Flavobacterium sp. NKUCC04_CG]|uniref:CinA family nicotinamide mononucleotide deamidase-related protein n=1 Tax=Flavobacterium sp. NKUCC04_CG TaxID=2842121 RepID=UPI001C5BB716|nr:CinA family nicotinamide mononucleotide deamidase-related protein [Flavobacterium sp. NKUCC04_CG]MBW3520238.1 CinA family nicotinamide mononucleotide deamidase-related protein [Flavobacterium sp. NKUCC04_CG]
MKATIITIGDEILIGQIVDTNSAFIAKELDGLGFQMVEILTVSDEKTAIDTALLRQLDRVDLVVVTGGLGPTKDDVTKKVFCNFFDDVLVENQSVLTHVTALMERYYKRPISEVNKQQAWVPSQATVLLNRVGTAPGMLMKKGDTYFVSLPGVPFEMKTIVLEELIPWIKKQFSGYHIVHRNIITIGIGESLLAEYLENWESSLPNGVSLAYLPSPGRVRLRLSTSGSDLERLQSILQQQINQLPDAVIAYVSSYEDESLEITVAKLFEKSKKTISFAESCTGGRLAQLFSSIPGSSAFFKGGIVTYATESKIDFLGVSAETIAKNSVVSEEVAVEMAQKARQKFKSDYAIATTGNAGPSKGDSNAEIGTVFIGISTPEKTFATEFFFGQPREKVVDATVLKGLELIYKEILKNV